MAGNSDAKKQMMRFGGTILYYLVVLCLIVLIYIMYDKWKDQKKQYDQLVLEASLQDQAYAIEYQKDSDESEELMDSNTDTPNTTKE